MLKIGALKLNSNIFMASMAGCADLAFRLIAREHGAEYCFLEMSDSNSVVRFAGRKTDDILQAHPADIPLAAQLLGSDPETMLKAAEIMLKRNRNISFFDINAACPIKKIIKKKAGAYLIKEPESLFRIIQKLSSALPLPVTVKLRTGYLEKDREGIVSIAKKCEESGARTIFVHGRTMEQGYSGGIDHDSIRAIKAGVEIPVIASGNIFSPQKAKEMLELTGCDGVLVARGACGNPWIFRQIQHYLTEGILLPDPSPEEKRAVLVKHLKYIQQYKLLSEKYKVGFSRKVAVWYLNNFDRAAVFRDAINRSQGFAEIYKLIAGLF